MTSFNKRWLILEAVSAISSAPKCCCIGRVCPDKIVAMMLIVIMLLFIIDENENSDDSGDDSSDFGDDEGDDADVYNAENDNQTYES